ncbi:MAG: DUF2142 domain-containing protein, partial [Oscillospiraceae bacterium]
IVIVTLLAIVRTPEDKLKLNGFARAWSILIALGVCALIALICMTWTPINFSTIYGIQGRYLLPVLPLLLIALRSDNLTLKRNIDSRLMFALVSLDYLVMLDAFAVVLYR